MAVPVYAVLGRSGLRVSPFCLGAMTFGASTEWSAKRWGTDEQSARAIFNRYVDAGGNFVDTAITYMEGQSETLVGKFIAERGLRDQIVIGTKSAPSTHAGNPNAHGNGAKNIRMSVDTSLRRLGTDYVDLYWMHFWDTVTPAESVVATMDQLVREGKILHYGFSNVPAWYLTQAHTLARLHGLAAPMALQMEYSLVSRHIEREHLPATQELGIGVCTWSPLASGFLSGKYKTIGQAGEAAGRLDTMANSPLFDRDKEQNWRILDTVNLLAQELGLPPAQVALSWLAGRGGVTSIILGATRLEQFVQNLGAADVVLPDDVRAQLDAVSAIEVVSPYEFFVEPHRSMLRGKYTVSGWRAAPFD